MGSTFATAGWGVVGAAGWAAAVEACDVWRPPLPCWRVVVRPTPPSYGAVLGVLWPASDPVVGQAMGRGHRCIKCMLPRAPRSTASPGRRSEMSPQGRGAAAWGGGVDGWGVGTRPIGTTHWVTYPQEGGKSVARGWVAPWEVG